MCIAVYGHAAQGLGLAHVALVSLIIVTWFHMRNIFIELILCSESVYSTHFFINAFFKDFKDLNLFEASYNCLESPLWLAFTSDIVGSCMILCTWAEFSFSMNTGTTSGSIQCKLPIKYGRRIF